MLERTELPGRGPGASAAAPAPWDRVAATRWWLPALLALTVALRLPMIGSPLSADEGGLLYVAARWEPGGSSLYGDHWVDRPPLLVAFFAAADAGGGAVALRLLGCGLAVVSVLLAHRLGRRLGGPRAAGTAALVAAAATTSPLFGSWEVDSELVALPLVLGGILLLRGATTRAWVGAGALGMAAVLVKQNLADVLVLGVVLLVAELGTREGGGFRDVVRRGAALAAGALATVALVGVVAALRGTSPTGLWDALVVFRVDASQVIAASSGPATLWRLGRLLAVIVVSGTGLVLGLVLVRARQRPRTPWVVGAAALVAWEVLGALAGGSYWLHYLVGLVPGLVVGTALLVDRPGPLTRALHAGVALLVASACLANLWVGVLARPYEPPGTRVGSWLAATAHPGDTAVVLFGAPNILESAGLDSPYSELWSLPVRTRDPELRDLTAVLDGARPPTWLVVNGRSIATWGVDSRSATAVAREHYRVVRRFCGYSVLLRVGFVRDVPPAPRCPPPVP